MIMHLHVLILMCLLSAACGRHSGCSLVVMMVRDTVGLVCYAIFLVVRLCEFYRNHTIKNRKINMHITYIAQ